MRASQNQRLRLLLAPALSHDTRAKGETEERLYLLDAWHESLPRQ